MLEAAQYDANAFVTLTYDDEHLPQGGTLIPEHYQSWLKRLRVKVAPSRFRFYLVGEYGDDSFRPHYHAALFGFQTCERGRSVYTLERPNSCCYWCDLVRATWGKGNVYLGTLEDDSAGYMAQYVTKKMTSKDDPRLGGRHPEFARQSLKPGIGHDALWEIADALMRYELDSVMVDVPNGLRHGPSVWPLGRYMRQNLRKYIGRDKKVPQAVVDEMAATLLPLRLAAKASSDEPSLKHHVMAVDEGRVASMLERNLIFSKKRTL